VSDGELSGSTVQESTSAHHRNCANGRGQSPCAQQGLSYYLANAVSGSKSTVYEESKSEMTLAEMPEAFEASSKIVEDGTRSCFVLIGRCPKWFKSWWLRARTKWWYHCALERKDLDSSLKIPPVVQ
jgi:hypothetical protein